MQVERLEHRIRAVPGVIACQLTGSAALVLVGAGSDPKAVSQEVTRILSSAAALVPVQVLAAPAPASPGWLRRRHALVLVGSAAALSMGVAAAATVGTIDPGLLRRDPSPAGQAASTAASSTARGPSKTTIDSVARRGLGAELLAPSVPPAPATDPAGGADPIDAPAGAPVDAGPTLLAIPLPDELAAAIRATPAALLSAALAPAGDEPAPGSAPAAPAATAPSGDGPISLAAAATAPVSSRRPRGVARRVRAGFDLARPPLPDVPSPNASPVATAPGDGRGATPLGDAVDVVATRGNGAGIGRGNGNGNANGRG